ncbi:MAG: hypothetical protein EA413_13815 [Cyanobium sp. PLM2.Bin73]|jgi:hypothetical protein|nr:MAG: hypothetical protein EA413_13815 [Cyanobium sp. PLM2.Bin73]
MEDRAGSGTEGEADGVDRSLGWPWGINPADIHRVLVALGELVALRGAAESLRQTAVSPD